MEHVYIVYVTPHKLDGSLGRRRVHKVFSSEDGAFNEAEQKYKEQVDWPGGDKSAYQVTRWELGD